MSKLVLVAVGGNALIRPGQSGTVDEQFQNAMEVAAPVVQLLKAGYRVVLAHGNGPQIGAALMRSEIAAGEVYRLPYDCCVAATQGEIGYVLQHALWQMLQREKLDVQVVSLITQVVVDRRDPAFHHPTKPIGPFYSKGVADRYCHQLGWSVAQDSTKGWRRVVPSPEPKEIVELEAIRACVDRGLMVIAGGGGGVPVFNDHDISKGVEAVIDKDLTSALLASRLDADILAIATGVPRVFLDYQKPTERAVERLTTDECRRYLAEGQFPEGSMGPKIHATVLYLEQGGKEAVITDIAHLLAAIIGEAGTHIRSSKSND
ncbi:MAG: carbamate kinase [Ignavibacteria bacterium]|nr:carbamate kinase [Ignavibacteria bacterium]